MKESLREIFRACLDAIDLDRVLADRLSIDADRLRCGELRLDWSEVDSVVVVAMGKAGAALADYVAPRLPRPSRGIVVAPEAPRGADGWCHIIGGHPVPDTGSFRAADEVLELLASTDEKTLALFLLSGGGSSMVERPLDPSFTLEECRAFHDELVRCGADIAAINTLRKCASAVKGGRLARAAHPARCVTLYVSDVAPDDPAAIASGPTFPTVETAGDCRRIVAEFDLDATLPAVYRDWFATERSIGVDATDPVFARSSYAKLLDNEDAVSVLEREAVAREWNVVRLELAETATMDAAVEAHVRLAEQLVEEEPERTACVVSGGEIPVMATGDVGIGGRNSSLALAVARRIHGRPIAFLSAGTDGIDGNSPAAGAVVDGESSSQAKRLGLDLTQALERHDAYPLLRSIDATIEPGPTGNNVRDVRMLVHRSRR